MSPVLVLSILILYLGFILFIGYLTGRKANNDSFFLGNRNSPWYIVAFGMIGASISGVTMLSVPGWVGESQFTYFQMVVGFPVGYIFIITVLLPVYYKLRLTSIYTYLNERFGFWSYKTGAVFFLFSKIIGSSFRVYLVTGVLHISVFQNWNIPFWFTVIVSILLIWLYTFQGGIKTIIWTDTLQTFFLLLAAILTFVIISRELNLSIIEMAGEIADSEHSKIFSFSNWKSGNHFVKYFLSGAFIAIIMTGMDQDQMQKNLSCRNLRDARKNMGTLGFLLVPINLFFLALGAALYIYANNRSIPIPERADELYPLIATQGGLPVLVGLIFIVGLVAATYSSADSALTGMTTSFTLDILNGSKLPELKLRRYRILTHIGLSAALLIVILLIRLLNSQSVIAAINIMAGYTYGPILGLFSFGLFTNYKIRDKAVPLIAIASPIITYIIASNSQKWFNGYEFQFEILILNGLITFLGLFLIRKTR